MSQDRQGRERVRLRAFADEGASGQVEDHAAVHLRVEREVNVVERAIWINQPRLLATALQQSIGAGCQFVRDEARDQIDGRHGFGSGVARRVSSMAAIPPSRSWRSDRSSSMKFMVPSPGVFEFGFR